MAAVSGEAAQAKGADGAQRAKRWLESTTRVNAQWVNPEPSALPKLTFQWPRGGQSFSFDLHGVLKYGDYDGQTFYAECKNYEKPSDLGTHYLKFLAQCYVALEARAAYCEHFFWISWSPHNVNSWNQLTTAEYVRDAVIQHWQRIFDVGSEEDARKAVNEETCKAVAERLWLIVLSQRQETLVISAGHRALIEAHEIEKAG